MSNFNAESRRRGETVRIRVVCRLDGTDRWPCEDITLRGECDGYKLRLYSPDEMLRITEAAHRLQHCCAQRADVRVRSVQVLAWMPNQSAPMDGYWMEIASLGVDIEILEVDSK